MGLKGALKGFVKKTKHFFTDSWEQRTAAAGRWVAKNIFGYDEDSSSSDNTEVEDAPTIDGAKNSSGANKVIPLILGKTKIAPYYCANPYRTISGDDGETQTYHALYMLGYKNIDVGDIKLGQIDLSSGNTDKQGVFVNSFGTVASTDKSGIYADSTANIYVELLSFPSKPQWVWRDGFRKYEEDVDNAVITEGSYSKGVLKGSVCKFTVDDTERTLYLPSVLYIPVTDKKGKIEITYKGTLQSGNVSSAKKTELDVLAGYKTMIVCNEEETVPIIRNCEWAEYSTIPDGICSISDITTNSDGTVTASFNYTETTKLTINGTEGNYVRLITNSAELLSYKVIAYWEQSGELPIDGRWNAAEYNIHLELREGENTSREDGEVALYPQKVNEEELNIELEHISDSNDTSGTGIMLANRVTARNPQKVQIEFSLNGLFLTNDGRKEANVSICIQYSTDGGQTYKNFGAPRIDATDSTRTWTNEGSKTITVHGKSITADVYTLKGNKTKVLRYVAERIFTYDEAINAKNRYIELRIFRYNVKGVDGDNTSYNDTIVLSAIRTWCYDYTKSLEAKTLVPQAPLNKLKRNITARLGFQVDADRTEFKNQLNELNCILTSKGRSCTKTTDGNGNDVYEWSGAISPTQNPASIALMFLQHESRGVYAYSDEQLDLQSFGELYFHCAEIVNYKDTSIPRFRCNGALTSQAKTSDVLSDILSTCRAKYVLKEKKYGVWIDKENSKISYLLNAQNVLSSEVSKEFTELNDGVKVTFVNEDGDYNTDNMTVLYDDTKANDTDLTYQSLEMKYQTSPAQVFSNAKYYLADKKLRCESITVKVSVDGNLINLGDKVGVQLDSLSSGIGEGAQITAITYNEKENITRIKIDGKINLSDYDLQSDKFMIAINQSGGDYISVKLYIGIPILDPYGYVRYFEFYNPIQVGESYPVVGDIVSVGTYDYKASFILWRKIQNVFVECLVFGKKDNGDGTFTLTLTPYQEKVYTADKYKKIPEFDSKVTKRKTDSYFSPASATVLDVIDAVNNIEINYIHYVYNDSLDEELNYSTTETRKYIGIYTDNTEDDAQTYAEANAKEGIVWSQIEGKDGINGSNGIGIQSVQEYYAVSASKTEVPKNWETTASTMTATDKYLWNYEVITYTDGSAFETAKRVIGVYGETGATGKGISKVTNYYLATALSSGVTKDTTGWTVSVQAISSSKKYLWNYEVITYTDNSTSSTTPCVIGTYGDKGLPGAPGASGATSYFHIKYSSEANPASSSQMTETPDKYIGTYVDFTENDSDDPKKYKWSQFKGDPGKQGIPGVGEDGKTSYLHIAYATSADGKTGFSVDDSTDKTYIGQYTDFESTDSTDPTKYKWTLIKGAKGDSVNANLQDGNKDAAGCSEYSEFSNGIFTKKNSTTTKNYIYMADTASYVSPGKTYTISFEAKQDGNVSSVEVYYYGNDYSSTGYITAKNIAVTTEWKKFSHVFTIQAGRKLTNQRIRFDNNGTIKNGTVATLYVKNVKLEEGDTSTAFCYSAKDTIGAQGVSPTATISKKDGVTTISITDKNGTHTQTVKDGTDGSNGVGVSSTKIVYQATSSTTAPAKPASASSLGSWKTSFTDIWGDKSYLWYCEITTYTNGSSSVSEPTIIGVPVKAMAANSAFINKLFAQNITMQTGGAIKSDNYVAGSAGWKINYDGTAEFSDVSVRGSLFLKTFYNTEPSRLDEGELCLIIKR